MIAPALARPLPLVPRHECCICRQAASVYLEFRDPALGGDGSFCRDHADEHVRTQDLAPQTLAANPSAGEVSP